LILLRAAEKVLGFLDFNMNVDGEAAGMKNRKRWNELGEERYKDTESETT
jgi:hypothetical protein